MIKVLWSKMEALACFRGVWAKAGSQIRRLCGAIEEESSAGGDNCYEYAEVFPSLYLKSLTKHSIALKSPFLIWKPDSDLLWTTQEPLRLDRALVNKLVPCAWLSSGALEVWRLRCGKIKIPLLIPFRTKFNTKRIKPIHLERRILEAVTQPIYRERLYDPSKTCSILVKKQQEATQIKKSSELENRYESFLIREAWKVLDASQMVIAFQADSVGMRRRAAIHNMFYPIDLLPIYFPHEVIRKAIEPTRLRNLLPLIHRSTLVVTGKSLRVKEMIDLTKKIPDLALLGGFVGDRILTKQGLIDYAALPEMDGILGQMVGIIEALPQRTRSLLSAQQQNLSRNLDQYIAQEKDTVKSDQTGTSGEASS